MTDEGSLQQPYGVLTNYLCQTENINRRFGCESFVEVFIRYCLPVAISLTHLKPTSTRNRRRMSLRVHPAALPIDNSTPTITSLEL